MGPRDHTAAATSPPPPQSLPLRRMLFSPGIQHSRRSQLFREGSARGGASSGGFAVDVGSRWWRTRYLGICPVACGHLVSSRCVVFLSSSPIDHHQPGASASGQSGVSRIDEPANPTPPMDEERRCSHSTSCRRPYETALWRGVSPPRAQIEDMICGFSNGNCFSKEIDRPG